MAIPQANYVTNQQGQRIFVQISVQEWENFVNEYISTCTKLCDIFDNTNLLIINKMISQ